MENVYVVIRRNEDIKDHFVEIMGIFKDKNEAEKRREDIWKSFGKTTKIEKYAILDSLEEMIALRNAANTRRLV